MLTIISTPYMIYFFRATLRHVRLVDLWDVTLVRYNRYWHNGIVAEEDYRFVTLRQLTDNQMFTLYGDLRVMGGWSDQYRLKLSQGFVNS